MGRTKKIKQTKTEVFRLLDQFFGTEECAEDFKAAMQRCEDFPQELWALAYPLEGKFYCVQAPVKDGPLCLVVLVNRELAEACIAAMDDELADGCVPQLIDTESAIREAKERENIGAVLLLELRKRLRMQFVK